MKKIAYLASQYPAPSHTFIRREISALTSLGLTVIPYSVRPGPETGLEGGAAKVECLVGRPFVDYLKSTFGALRHPRRFWRTWKLALRHRQLGARGLLWSQFHFVEALLLCRLLEKAEVDRLHNHFANSGATVGLLASHYLAIPWSLTLHGISETDPPAGDLLPEKLLHADFVACASWFMQAQGMRKVSSAEWTKFHIVRCGIDLRELPVAQKLSSKTVRFVCVGRLSAEKGYFGLLDAFCGLVSEGASVELEIVGDGPLREEIEVRLRELGCADKVHLWGALPERETLQRIADSDILVLPSLMEGLPVVLMEAMAMEKPVVASHVAGIPELVEDGRNGLLFRPGDWQQLRRKMHQLVSDPHLRREYGRNARLTIEQEFEIHGAVRPLEALFSTSE